MTTSPQRRLEERGAALEAQTWILRSQRVKSPAAVLAARQEQIRAQQLQGGDTRLLRATDGPVARHSSRGLAGKTTVFQREAGALENLVTALQNWPT